MTNTNVTPCQLFNFRTLQNYQLVWLDKNIDEHNNDSIEKLRQVVSNLNIFNDMDECINFIANKEETNFFVIISEEFSQNVVSVLQDISQVHDFYIYCKDNKCLEKRLQESLKTKNVYTDMTLICDAIERAVRNHQRNLVSISFVQSTYVCTKENLNQLDSSFMYTQILKEILLSINFEQKHIDEFLKYRRETFNSNNAELEIINKIEQEYHHHPSVWWYTSPYFLYSMLNNALRTMEVDLIIKIGFFIRDLHVYIAEHHAEQYNEHRNSATFFVYRGQGLSQTDFDQMKITQGGLISFNNFLSTSIDQHVSLAFAESNQGNPGMIGVLFKITIDPLVASSSFANIKNDSYFQGEEEILFSMHSIFRVGDITPIADSNGLYQVNLVLTDDNDPQLYALTECIREETVGLTGWHRLGRLMLTLGQYDKAKELYEILLEEANNEYEKPGIYNFLGRIAEQQGEYAQAIINYEKSLEIRPKTNPLINNDLSSSYSNIGLVYNSMRQYSKALSFCEKAVEIEQNTLPINNKSLAKSYNNIALVYNNMRDYVKAILFYEKDLEITKKILPANHPDLATSYNNIGMVYQNIGEHLKALECYEKTIEIFSKILAPDHHDLATIYNNIGTLYNKMQEYSKALSSHEKALEIRQKCFLPNHPSLVTSYNHIGSVYKEMGKYIEALPFYEKALEINRKNCSSNNFNLGISYNNIAMIYDNTKEYQKALDNYEKAIEILQNDHSSNYFHLFIAYGNMGMIYNNSKQYPKALFYYEKALEIVQKFFPEHGLDLATCYSNIGKTYYHLDNYCNALSYLEKAVEIEQKLLSADHPDLAISYDSIATVYKKMNEYPQALLYYERALYIKQKTLPVDDLSLALYYYSIAKVCDNMKEYAKALSYLQCSLDIFQRSLPPNNSVIEVMKENIKTVKEKL